MTEKADPGTAAAKTVLNKPFCSRKGSRFFLYTKNDVVAALQVKIYSFVLNYNKYKSKLADILC